jgi:DNA-binding transcriptional LysR family regulator
MRALNLEQLRTFMHVAELGSFTAAADLAGLTQPAVSLQVKQLEHQLGVRLLERVGRRAQPTPAGLDLIRHAERIEKDVADALDAMAPYRSGTIGRVRIGTGATACIHLLPAAITAAKQQMPGLEVVVRVGNTEDILNALEANKLDLAVVTLPATGRSIEVEAIYEDELMAVGAPGDAAFAGSVDAAALSARPLLLYEGGNTRRMVDGWFARSGLQVKAVMEFGSVEAIKELVRAGLGWSILPRLALAQAERTGSLQTFRLNPGLARTLGMVVRRDKHLSRGLREMMQSIRANLPT